MLFDMHVHSSEGSPCSRISAKELVNVYKEMGYDGIVLTDHMIEWYRVNCHKLEYNDYCRNNYEAFLTAKDEGDKVGLTVLHGCELRINDVGYNDYLIYGFDRGFFLENPDIFSWSLDRFSMEFTERGMLVYQAHPFRNGVAVVDPKHLYGFEVYNGGGNTRNEIANIWADKYNLHKIAGSDCHTKDGAGRAGVKFINKVYDNKSLVEALRNNDYYLVERPE